MSDGDGGFFGSLFGGGGGGDWTTDAVSALDAAALEDVLAALFEAEGADVERAGPNAEGGVRLVVRVSKLLGTTKTVVTPRPAEFTVSRGFVEHLDRARSMHGADAAFLVRPAGFDDRVREATASTKVELLDDDALVRRLDRAGVDPEALGFDLGLDPDSDDSDSDDFDPDSDDFDRDSDDPVGVD